MRATGMPSAPTVSQTPMQAIGGFSRAVRAPNIRELFAPQSLGLWGGTDPQKGLDCSGLVQLVYRNHGVDLPRPRTPEVMASREVFDLMNAIKQGIAGHRMAAAAE